MSRKNVTLPYRLISDVTIDENYTSSPTNIRYLDNVGIELVWTGTPTGTFYIEGTVSGNTWQALDFGSAVSAVGAEGSHLLNINQCPYDQLRISYIATSGTGTLNGYIIAKEI